MDSSKNPVPPMIVSTFQYLPPTENPGSNDIAINETLMGIKLAINMVEIITTIFATFRLRSETVSDCELFADVFRHFDFSRKLTTKVIVETVTAMKALNGTKTLLIMNETVSTVSLFCKYTSPHSVLFLLGSNL